MFRVLNSCFIIDVFLLDRPAILLETIGKGLDNNIKKNTCFVLMLNCCSQLESHSLRFEVGDGLWKSFLLKKVNKKNNF